jgi:putative tRNA adenosine deaminase-associated protein
VPGPAQAEAYAVVVGREQGRWLLEELPEAVTDDLRALVAAVAAQPGDGGAFALVDVADEFFVVVRVQAGRVRLLLSDVTAAAEWDLARQVVDHLGIAVPRDDALERVVPAGDVAVFDDLGLDGSELVLLLSDVDAYADELLAALARRLGFASAYERVVEALVQ